MNQNVNMPPLNPNDLFYFTQSPNPLGNDGGGDSGRRAGVPPSHWSSLPPISPYSQIPTTIQPIGSQNFSPGPSISRSMSQPSSIFSFDSLPPLSPSSASFRDFPTAPLADYDVSVPPMIPRSYNSVRFSGSSTLPPRKAHKRSNSDIAFAVDSILAQKPQKWIHPKPIEYQVGVTSEEEGIRERKAYGEDMDQIFSEYMNMDKIDASKGNENGDDMGDSDEETSGDEIGLTTLGVKRRAGKDIAPSSRHYRSVSVDSCVNGKLSIGEESPKPSLSPGKASPTNSVDGNENAFSLESGKGVFTASEMKQIAGSDKLKEMAVSNPKHVKRILANRAAAARSKEKKARYLAELELKVLTLETENTTKSTKYTHLQRENMELKNDNQALRIRLQGMEQRAQLSDALIEQLTGRRNVERGEVSQNMQSMNANMFQQLNINQLHQPQRNPNFQ